MVRPLGLNSATSLARSPRSIGRLLGKPVHLFLRVKVSERWQDNRERFSAIGLDFDA